MRIVPQQQTKLLFALMAFATATMLLLWGFIDEHVWKEIVIFTLGIYAAGNVAATWVFRNGQKSDIDSTSVKSKTKKANRKATKWMGE